jgi:hypothetical protein
MRNDTRFKLIILALLFPAISHANLQGCFKESFDKAGHYLCDVSFTAVPAFINQCTATVQAGTYTITNNTPVTLLINPIQIISSDSFPASASVIVPAAANNCGSSLAAGASCNIEVELQPLALGTYNRFLQVGINSRQVQLSAPLITSAVNCGSPNPVPPPIPIPVGATLCTILGASTITNTGATVVTGDLCLTPGSAVTGFPPGVITGNGGLPDINDATAISAKAAANTLFLNLNGLPCTTSFAIPTDIGGQILTPGVYCFASTAAITGTLTLSGAGNYVFLVGTTFTTAIGSNVILTNGADAHDIYWNVGTSATLGGASSFLGRIIANVSVTFGAGANLVVGTASALNAAVTLNDNIVTPPP